MEIEKVITSMLIGAIIGVLVMICCFKWEIEPKIHQQWVDGYCYVVMESKTRPEGRIDKGKARMETNYTWECDESSK